MTANNIVNAGARLDRLPISRFHWRILILIAAGAFLDAYDIYLGSGVVAATLKEGFSTLQLNAVFISCTFIGMLIGSGVAGFVGDHFGRRYSYQTNLLIFGLASIAACFAPNMQVLIGCRFVMGVGLGAELVVCAGTLGEFIPPSHRGRWLALLAMLIHFGLTTASLVGYYVIPRFGWRWMFASAGIAALIVWFMRKSMPESPRWLESKGRKEEAEATLRAIEEEVAAQVGVLPPVTRVQDGLVVHAPFSDLFDRKMFKRTYLAALTVVAVNVAVYGFVAWLPSFFVKQGFTMTKSLGVSLLMSIGAIVGTVIGYFVSDRFGRRNGIIVSLLATLAVGYVYPNMHDQNSIIIVGMLMLACLYLFVTLGLYGYVPELFATQYRLRGTGLSGMCGRGSAILTPYMTVYLFTNYGVYGVVSLVAVLLVILLISVVVLNIETAGASLEDISQLKKGAREDGISPLLAPDE